MTSFYEDALQFINTMPYKSEPYSGRNWGDKWHSLCSYHGKLKPSIAHFLIEKFTNPGDIVLDPLSGVGTIPFEACLQGRIGIGNDLSELAYCVTKAKLERPKYDSVIESLDELNDYIKSNATRYTIENAPYKKFGYNGNLIDYFHEDTFMEILLSRDFFIDRLKNLTPSEAVVFSSLLHVLHGNRPYALSRRSHPLTPYAPSGDYIYKNVITHILNKINIVYKAIDSPMYVQGKTYWGSYEVLKDIQADIIITSPPFANSIRFYMQNWMRLWFCGWEPEDFKLADTRFIDNAQNSNFDIYLDFFESCSKLLKENGKVILHLGKTQKVDMAKELSIRASNFFDIIYQGNEIVSGNEKHGIKDKGTTIEHQFLFLAKK